jgi:hypothetical protein
MKLVFSSTLPVSQRDALERLLFFNPRQGLWRQAIATALERYGVPQIVAGSSTIRVAIGGNEDVQSLFALSQQSQQATLLGMVMFLRTSPADLIVIHIAVAGYLSRRGRAVPVALALIRTVHAAANRLKGIKRVGLLYREAKSASQLVKITKDKRYEARGGLQLLRPAS